MYNGEFHVQCNVNIVYYYRISQLNDDVEQLRSKKENFGWFQDM